MPNTNLLAGALSLLLIHAETGCPHSAIHAARLLDTLSEMRELDETIRQLCARASDRLSHKSPLPSHT